jgi:nicotinamidase-related amidase
MTKVNRKQALKKMTMSAGLLALSEIGGGVPSVVQERDSEDKVMQSTQEKSIDWKTSALIVVDMQNDFVRKGAPLEVPTALGTAAAQKALILAFRSRKLPIVFTKFISHPHYYLLWEWSPQCQPPTKCCWKGHQRHYQDISASRDCTEIIDELLPSPEDIIIEKFGYGAFHGTSLTDTLHARSVTTLAITGTVTQICVEETAREAFHHGFRTTLVEDGVSSFAPDLHAATLKNFAMKFGWVSKSDKIISGISALK